MSQTEDFPVLYFPNEFPDCPDGTVSLGGALSVLLQQQVERNLSQIKAKYPPVQAR